ncbi:MAG: class I SAM-dependent methyltransferase [Candidatus Aenigmatarchaeota archaeon]
MSDLEKLDNKVGYKSVIDLGREAKVGFPHDLFDYPTKILPQIIGEFIDRFSSPDDLILDPFAGGGTVAVECALRLRRSISIDINPNAVEVTKKKLEVLKSANLFGDIDIEQQKVILGDARKLDIPAESVDAVITDIPYADMIKYSNIPDDISTIEDYESFIDELYKALSEMYRVLKKEKYCIIFVADYRIGRSRVVIPIHADVIYMMQNLGFVLFDLYIWRYYRSGSFRPFGAKPYQAMNTHTYILVFYKPDKPFEIIKNREIRYRKRLLEKLNNNL